MTPKELAEFLEKRVATPEEVLRMEESLSSNTKEFILMTKARLTQEQYENLLFQNRLRFTQIIADEERKAKLKTQSN